MVTYKEMNSVCDVPINNKESDFQTTETKPMQASRCSYRSYDRCNSRTAPISLWSQCQKEP